MSEGEKHPGEAGRGKKEEDRPRRRLRLRREDSAASAWLFGHLTQRVRSRAPLETASAGGGMWERNDGETDVSVASGAPAPTCLVIPEAESRKKSSADLHPNCTFMTITANLCPTQIPKLKSKAPVPQNVTIFEERALKGVIKLK